MFSKHLRGLTKAAQEQLDIAAAERMKKEELALLLREQEEQARILTIKERIMKNAEMFANKACSSYTEQLLTNELSEHNVEKLCKLLREEGLVVDKTHAKSSDLSGIYTWFWDIEVCW